MTTPPVFVQVILASIAVVVAAVSVVFACFVVYDLWRVLKGKK